MKNIKDNTNNDAEIGKLTPKEFIIKNVTTHSKTQIATL